MKVVVGLARGAGVVNGEWFVTARVSGQGPSRVKATSNAAALHVASACLVLSIDAQ